MSGGQLAAWRGNQRVLGVLLQLHGLVHLIGFVLAWKILEPTGFAYDDVRPAAGTWPGRLVGVGWVIVAAGLGVAGLRLVLERPVRPAVLAAPLVGSVALCVASAPAALFGAFVSGGLLVALGWLWARRAPAHGPPA